MGVEHGPYHSRHAQVKSCLWLDVLYVTTRVSEPSPRQLDRMVLKSLLKLGLFIRDTCRREGAGMMCLFSRDDKKRSRKKWIFTCFYGEWWILSSNSHSLLEVARNLLFLLTGRVCLRRYGPSVKVQELVFAPSDCRIWNLACCAINIEWCCTFLLLTFHHQIPHTPTESYFIWAKIL